MIDEGQAFVHACMRRGKAGPINAVHADADSVAATDWPQIVALYGRLLVVAPTPSSR